MIATKIEAKPLDFCRVCLGREMVKVLDLGNQPLANRFLKQKDEPEDAYPLDVFLCENCGHVQLGTNVDREGIFRNYVYFSGPNPGLSEHFRNYADNVKARIPSWSRDLIVEIGSNDGILLREFRSGADNVLGVDPAENIESAVPTMREFFGSKIAERILKEKGKKASIIMANNVLAHTYDLHDTVLGLSSLISDEGLVVVEAPWLGDMFETNAYDTIYHEHLSYFSIMALQKLFAQFGLVLLDLEFHPVQGKSFRAFFGKYRKPSDFAVKIITMEARSGWNYRQAFLGLGEKIARSKDILIAKLKALKKSGKTIAGYGAPAKGNTILNYTGAGFYLDSLIEGMPSKIGLFAPGSRLPIVKREDITPDAFVMFAWNYKPQILAKEKDYKGEWIIPNIIS